MRGLVKVLPRLAGLFPTSRLLQCSPSRQPETVDECVAILLQDILEEVQCEHHQYKSDGRGSRLQVEEDR